MVPVWYLAYVGIRRLSKKTLEFYLLRKKKLSAKAGLKNKYQEPRHKRAHETSWVTVTSTDDGKSLEFKQLFFSSVMYVSPL